MHTNEVGDGARIVMYAYMVKRVKGPWLPGRGEERRDDLATIFLLACRPSSGQSEAATKTTTPNGQTFQQEICRINI